MSILYALLLIIVGLIVLVTLLGYSIILIIFISVCLVIVCFYNLFMRMFR